MNVKTKNFKAALQESHIWITSKGSTSPNTTEIQHPTLVEHSIEPPVSSPSTHPNGSTPPAVNTPTLPQAPVSTPTPRHLPSPPTIKPEHLHEPADQGVVVDVPLSSELAKIWDYVEVDEDTIDGFVVISSEKNMSPVVAFYNEHKRKLGVYAPQTSPKRLKMDSTASLTPTPSKPHARAEASPSGGSSVAAPHLYTVPASIPFASPPAHQPSGPAQSTQFTLPPFSAPTQNTTERTQTLGQKGTYQRHTFTGAATNGFAQAPLRGIVEGGEDGLHVEFAVQGHTYRGFLLARESFPALVSPLVPPVYSPTYLGYSPYINLAKATAVAVTKHHHERLVDLGRLVVASAMVPYAYPPPLHL